LGDNERYEENFIESSELESWKPAAFIKGLITDLNSDINVTPIIDDRMLVNCWYANDAISQSITDNTDFANSETWYKHTFIDEGDDSTCQNDEMRKELLKESTYKRWQKYGSLYGISRYSLVCLTGEGYFSTAILARHMKTLYARLFELAIVQQASILRFSQEVAEVNKMFNATNKEQRYDIRRVESLHYAYINFINSIYFLDVTAQDQGIELYDLLKKQFRLQEREADLENEIGKLYEFVSMKEEKNSAENGERLNLIAAFLVPTTLVLAVFGMNDIGIHLNNEGKFPIFYLGENSTGILLQLIITGIVFALSVMLLIHYIRGQKNRTK
jgi:Mg2+ and Co2+ transporter CorA